MYIFSAWKLALILAVLLFSILYLLPTTYDNLYGYLPLWMQESLPVFDVIDDHTLKTSLKETGKFSYPSGKNYRKVVNELSDVLDSQLNKIGLSEVTGDYIFETTAEREFHVKFLSEIHVQKDQYLGKYQTHWYRTLKRETVNGETKWKDN